MGTDMQFQIILFYGNYSENVKTMGVVNDMIGNFRVQKCFVLGVLFESSWELVLLGRPSSFHLALIGLTERVKAKHGGGGLGGRERVTTITLPQAAMVHLQERPLTHTGSAFPDGPFGPINPRRHWTGPH